jgi:ribonucleoside-diphosphate reductase alpha chain
MQQNDLVSSLVVVKRTGDALPYDPSKITVAVTKAFIEVNGSDGAVSTKDVANRISEAVTEKILRRGRASVAIEEIQDMVELELMRAEQFAVAKSYILFRQRQAERRMRDAGVQASPPLLIKDGLAERAITDMDLSDMIEPFSRGLQVSIPELIRQVRRDVFNGCSMLDVRKAIKSAARTLIEIDPDYSRFAARVVVADLYTEVIGAGAAGMTLQERAQAAFRIGIEGGIKNDLVNPELGKFDLDRLAAALKPARDEQFDFLGIVTLYDRYFFHVGKRRIEAPQGFFMRVAMGLALNEKDREARAIEFYEALSSFDFMSSTPTLFNSGTLRSQLSSCYLTTVDDDLESIYDALKENALLSKFAGGLGNDWTPVRAMGSHIKGTNGESQGVVPFLKVVNDTAVAVNQGGKRKGAVCAYLETWHLDIEEFLELRKNTGDDRRRTHDMNTANWIPDLFMKRVMEKGEWTLFTPNLVPDLHEKFGVEFEVAYQAYEARAKKGELKPTKTVQAVDLWRKMLTMLFETGHPWITFKDACNVRSPQQHIGVVHSSNLCTEITLNTSDSEIAVCNLGSVNLVRHLKDGKIDHEKLRRTVRTAMRMLDNVIDINYYAVKKSATSNARHRPVGLGIMAFQDLLFELRVPYSSDAAVQIADEWMEAVCYYAYEASSDMAVERGKYQSYDGSLWSRGILPLESINLLEQARGQIVDVDRSFTMDWNTLRTKILAQGMRNSNCVAIAPTATISNIIGVDASIEPCFGNLSVKSNLAGEFTVINPYLVRDLKELGLWDSAMVVDLKHFDGSVQAIERIPAELREIYKTAFEVDTLKMVEAAARRQKWIDQAQSLNIYLKGASGKKLDETYKSAWLKGLKTTYYLRTLGATHAEKSTIATGALNAVASGHSTPQPEVVGAVCTMRPGDPGFEGCEACQ